MSIQETVSSNNTPPALEELQARPQWVCWRKEARGGKPTKVPYNPRTGALARSDDPATWASYAQAQAAWDKRSHRYDGLGYMFAGDYTGIDLDQCVNAASTIDPWAQEVLDRLPSYAEYSPSGSGIHILVRGTIPGGTRRPVPGAPNPLAAIEMYSERRYFTVTGHQVAGTPPTIESCPDLLRVYTELTMLRRAQDTARSDAHHHEAVALSDDALIEKALAGRNRARFRALWSGASTGYASPSEADLALCRLLAFWTGKDAARMDRLYRRSGLYQQEHRQLKWDRPARAGETYGQGTIARAIAGCRQIYEQGVAARPDHKGLPDHKGQGWHHPDHKGLYEHKVIPFPTRRSAATPGMEALGPLPETELAFVLDCLTREEEGDARLYAHLFRDKCVYDHTEGAWYEWHAHFWERDECKHALLLASGPLAAVYLEASATLSEQAAQEARRIDPQLHDEETDQLRERYTRLKAQTAALIERARALRRLHRAQAVLTYAQALLTITADQWDTNPWLLGTRQGTLDLRTGTLHPGQPQESIRTVIPTPWRGLEERAPRFERFLQEIFADRPDSERKELLTFLQRALGYGITGHVSEHIFLMLYGEEGRNGKDTLMTVLQRVLGHTVGAVSNDVIIASGKFTTPGAAKPHLCALQGKRIAWASETDRGARFDVGQVKFLTGGGAIPARQLYGRDYVFEPSHLLILLTNHKPHADARDAAFWDRLCPILFTLRFVDQPTLPNERQRDTRLARALEAEVSGILAWLVCGCLAWQQDGLQVPASVLQARHEYRGEEDTLGQFLQECCLQSEGASVKAGQVYEHYKIWAQHNTLKPMTGLAFGLEMKKRFLCKRDKRGMCYVGLALVAEEEATGVGSCSTPESAQDGARGPHISSSGVGSWTTPGSAQDGARGPQISSSGVGCVGVSQKLPHEGSQNENPKVSRNPYTPYTSSSIGEAFQQPPRPVDVPFSGSELPYTGNDEQKVQQLLELVRKKEAGMTNLLWHVPGSGFEDGYLLYEEYFRRLEVCLASRDPARRQAAIDEMNARVAR
jgi:putative DNA primase/helicase